jgi:hypothetical protein
MDTVRMDMEEEDREYSLFSLTALLKFREQ